MKAGHLESGEQYLIVRLVQKLVEVYAEALEWRTNARVLFFSCALRPMRFFVLRETAKLLPRRRRTKGREMNFTFPLVM